MVSTTKSTRSGWRAVHHAKQQQAARLCLQWQIFGGLGDSSSLPFRAIDTKSIVDNSKDLQSLGVDELMFYRPPEMSGLKAHFEAVGLAPGPGPRSDIENLVYLLTNPILICVKYKIHV